MCIRDRGNSLPFSLGSTFPSTFGLNSYFYDFHHVIASLHKGNLPPSHTECKNARDKPISSRKERNGTYLKVTTQVRRRE